jgi:Domain of unknown function (DUF4349)
MPATDTDFEREFAELVAQLREAPTAAPDSLRARVRALGEPEAPPSLRDRVAIFPWRRAVLVAVPVCLAVLVSAAVVRGLVSAGGGGSRAEAVTTVAGSAESGTRTAKPAKQPPWGTVTTDQKGVLSAGLGAGTGGRAADVDASLRVRVPDLDALSDRTSQAMQITRALGGYVVSVQQTTTAGQPGEADLQLRVPVGKVDTALVRLADLGTVVDRHLSIVDLEQTLAQQRRQIRSLRFQIARLQQALRNESLPVDVRLRIQFQLESARGKLSGLLGTNKTTLREAALSDLSLALTTPRAAGSATGHHEGRFGRAARDAGSFLLSAGAVALFVLIAVSPLLVLGAVWLYGSRAYRRREERRLLTPAPE